nr:hypothetical protein [uncultured Draconibacterium sp.]
MKAKTFRLSNPRTWKREVRVFMLNKEKKFEQILLPFTTEGEVPAKMRTKRGRTIPAKYSTSNPEIIRALYSDSAYGKDFYEVGDEKFENKLPTLVVTKEDAELVALRSLYKGANLEFVESDSLEVAKKKYEIHLSALAGVNKIGESTATEIPHIPVDPQKQMNEAIAKGKADYEKKYGEPVPEEIAGDKKKLLALIDGLNTPGFNVQAYVAEATKVDEEESTEEESPEPTKEELLKKYFDKFDKNVPNTKKNDLGWIKDQLAKPE